MAYSLRHTRMRGILYAAAVMALDQWSKLFFMQGVQMRRHVVEITSFFNITVVLNRGISFGMFAEAAPWMPLILTILTSAIVVVLMFWLMRARETAVVSALGIIIGGALGNILDRVHYGFVIDFLDFHLGRYHWPAFNIADSAVFMGVVILCLMSIVSPHTDL